MLCILITISRNFFSYANSGINDMKIINPQLVSVLSEAIVDPGKK